MSRPYILRGDHARDAMATAWRDASAILAEGKAVKVTVSELKATRSLDQNALMWSVLTDIARQVQWPVDGQMRLLDPEDWKEILSAGLTKHQRVAQGIEGGFVMLGKRTSKMTIDEMGDLITLCHAFGAERGVRWSPTSVGREAA